MLWTKTHNITNKIPFCGLFIQISAWPLSMLLKQSVPFISEALEWAFISFLAFMFADEPPFIIQYLHNGWGHIWSTFNPLRITMNYCYDMYKCAFIMLCKCIISMLLMWWFKLIWSDSVWDRWILCSHIRHDGSSHGSVNPSKASSVCHHLHNEAVLYISLQPPGSIAVLQQMLPFSTSSWFTPIM